jgi:hypothetical protein
VGLYFLLERLTGRLTPVLLCSIQVGNHRGSRLLCWSSRNCMGSWRMNTRSRRGRHWRTGQRRTLRGRHTCNSLGCCSRKQSHRHWGWSIHSHLLRQIRKLLHREEEQESQSTHDFMGEFSPQSHLLFLLLRSIYKA